MEQLMSGFGVHYAESAGCSHSYEISVVYVIRDESISPMTAKPANTAFCEFIKELLE